MRLLLFLGIASLLTAVVVTTFVVIRLTAGEPSASPESIAALSAWSSYVTAMATTLLVAVGITTAWRAWMQIREDQQDLRRAVVSLQQVAFDPDAISVWLSNVGDTAAVGVEVRLWAVPTSSVRHTPRELGDAVLFLTDEFEKNVTPLFEGNLPSLAPGQEREDHLRMGPRADQYSGGWADRFGAALWECRATDVFGNDHTTSGWAEVEPRES